MIICKRRFNEDGKYLVIQFRDVVSCHTLFKHTWFSSERQLTELWNSMTRYLPFLLYSISSSMAIHRKF